MNAAPELQFDVLVAGAGPAGCAGAYHLARGGARVALLDRATFPRAKVCGDGVTVRARYSLRMMGIDALPEERTQPIGRIRLYAESGRSVNCPLHRTVFGDSHAVLERSVFDQLLLDRARGAGAYVYESARLTDLSRDSAGVTARFVQGGRASDFVTIRARAVIGADGSSSTVRRSLGAADFRAMETSVGLRAYVENAELAEDGNAYHFFYLKKLLPGYGWIFPLPGGRANVGLGFGSERSRSGELSPRRAFAEFLEHPLVRERLGAARLVSEPRGAKIPMDPRRAPFVFDRVLLAGDAAGFVHPLTGDGIDYALESGKFAAEALLAGLERNDLSRRGLDGYRRRCEDRFLREFRRFRRRRSWCFHPRLVEAIIAASAEHPEVSNLLLGWQPRVPVRSLMRAARGLFV